jgi:phage shock protein C
MNIDPTIVRLLFVLLALAGGPGILIYLILWLVMPEV